MMFPLISTRKIDRIKRNSDQSDYDEYKYKVYDDYKYYDSYNKALYNRCDTTNEGEIELPWFVTVGNYEIIIQMGSANFSSTDDKVEIRLYGPNNERSEWLGLTYSVLIDGIYGFERLSQNTYCVETEKDFRRITKVGIQKFGTDRMMIDTISIKHGEFGSFFVIDQWIKEREEEFIFEAFSWF